MMARAIDAEDLIRIVSEKKMTEVFPNWKELSSETRNAIGVFGQYWKALIEDAPTIDTVKHGYVPIEVVRQIQWERDIAMSYLDEAGIGFGEKAELQRVKHGKWIDRMCRDWRCSECGGEICKFRHVDGYTRDDKPKYCPDCGARMDGE